ncbi:hypothetical protein [Brochothrix thermosphacta]|uniref:hypothetical protein n=1 Tax=Brochothrix thermosphacta TaxID=2756 RepID=UPI0039B01ECD
MILNRLIECSFWLGTLFLITNHLIRKKKIELEMKKIDSERLNEKIKQLESEQNKH